MSNHSISSRLLHNFRLKVTTHNGVGESRKIKRLELALHIELGAWINFYSVLVTISYNESGQNENKPFVSPIQVYD